MGGRLIGREAELERIAGAVVSVRDGASRCLLVTGEAGIGKTRLVAEAVGSLDDALVLTGHAVDMSTGEIPFGVLADTLRDLLRVAGPDALRPRERDVLAPLLPGGDPSSDVVRVRLLSAFVDLLHRLAAERPLVWVVEDLHWADAASRDGINLAARSITGRLLLVITIRTDDPDRSPDDGSAALTSYVAGLARLPHCEMVALGRLSPDQVRQQLADLTEVHLSPDVKQRIGRLSDGIPFVVEELAAAAGRPELASAATVAAGRLAGLSAEARRLVEAAAVGDGHLRISLVERVVDATPEELDVALAETVRAGVLTTDHEADAVSFRHSLLRDAVERETGPGARRAWHRRWAEVLEESSGVLAADPAALAVAEHWHVARDVRRSVLSAYAALPAVDRVGTSRDRVRMWMRMVDAWEVAADALPVTRPVAVAALLREATNAGRGFMADLASRLRDDRDPRVRSVVALMAASSSLAKGRWAADAGRMLADSLEVEDWPDDDLTALALNLAANSLPAADPCGDRFLDRSEAIALAHASSHLPSGRRGMRATRRARAGDIVGAIEISYSGLTTAPDMHPVDRWFQEGNLIWSLLACGRAREALEVAGPALTRIAHPQGESHAWEHLVENVAAAQLLVGDWQDARLLLEANAPYWPDDVRYSSLWLDLLDLQQRGHADLDRWAAVLDEAVAGGPLPDSIRRLLALAAGMRGDVSSMRDLAFPLWRREQQLEPDDDAWIDVATVSRLESDIALLGVRDGRAGEEHLSAIERFAAALWRNGELGEVWPLDLEAQIDRFHGRDARPALRAALEGWERLGHVPDAAVTHLSLAEQEAIRGERDAARHHLAEGRRIATGLEARPMLDRADILAERYGLTSRERRTTDVLTDRETEVLSLLAEGLTNTEIARRLFMSPKTASVHVSHILAKLGVANRTEAAATARRRGLIAT